jgi:hypothetical protein
MFFYCVLVGHNLHIKKLTLLTKLFASWAFFTTGGLVVSLFLTLSMHTGKVLFLYICCTHICSSDVPNSGGHRGTLFPFTSEKPHNHADTGRAHLAKYRRYTTATLVYNVNSVWLPCIEWHVWQVRVIVGVL